MAELLATYSVAEILGTIIALGLAAKGVITFWDWAYARIKKIFDKQQSNLNFNLYFCEYKLKYKE